MSVDDRQPSSSNRIKFRKIIWLIGSGILLVGFLIIGILWLRNRTPALYEAPEAESVLSAQLEMPFQVLIPAYLPAAFIREKVQISTDKIGPRGEPLIELVYTTRRGDSLTFYEWLPDDQATSSSKPYCKCVCVSRTSCNFEEVGMSIGSLRVSAKVSKPNIVTVEEARTILDTLGPAMNRQIYTSLKQVPVTFSVPPAIDIPLNADGLQEVTLVVTPNGYSPEHFSVQKGIPVKLTFRQIGQVGCGDQLIVQWDNGKSATLSLASSTDIQTLNFTPQEAGDFQFNCPHLIYRGVMTVKD
jgi:hypothetical protein